MASRIVVNTSFSQRLLDTACSVGSPETIRRTVNSTARHILHVVRRKRPLAQLVPGTRIPREGQDARSEKSKISPNVKPLPLPYHHTRSYSYLTSSTPGHAEPEELIQSICLLVMVVVGHSRVILAWTGNSSHEPPMGVGIQSC